MAASAASRAATIIPSRSKHTATLIFLHGLGDQGASWAPAWMPLQHVLPGLKIVCPNAPISPVTVNGGMHMPSWHDIVSLNSIDVEDFQGLPASIAQIGRLIDGEIAAGISSDRIVVGGFSQGAGVSCRSGFEYGSKLAGVIMLSGYLPFHGDFGTKISEANRNTPCFIGHGTADEVVQYRAGENARDRLKEANIAVTFRSYRNMGHSSCQQEIQDVSAFIVDLLK